MNCPTDEHLAAFVGHELAVTESADVALHISQCATCRGVEARLRDAVARMRGGRERPDAQFARDIVRHVFVSRVSTNPGRWLVALAAPAAALALVCFMAPWRLFDGAASPVARGDAGAARESRLGVEMLLHPRSDGVANLLVRGGEAFHEGDGLTFVVSNRTGQEVYLCLFGIDGAGSIHWFYPAVVDATTDPLSIHLAALPAVQQLPEGVTPEGLQPGRLSLVALFLSAPVKVSDVERAVASSGLGGLAGSLPLLGQQSETVEVE